MCVIRLPSQKSSRMLFSLSVCLLVSDCAWPFRLTFLWFWRNRRACLRAPARARARVYVCVCVCGSKYGHKTVACQSTIIKMQLDHFILDIRHMPSTICQRNSQRVSCLAQSVSCHFPWIRNAEMINRRLDFLKEKKGVGGWGDKKRTNNKKKRKRRLTWVTCPKPNANLTLLFNNMHELYDAIQKINK